VIAASPYDIDPLLPLRPRECLIHPFLGGEDEDQDAHQINGLYVPFNQGLYPSHARVLKTHPSCVDVQVGDVVIFPFMAYDWYNVIISGRDVRVAVVHEDKLFGKLEGWDDNT